MAREAGDRPCAWPGLKREEAQIMGKRYDLIVIGTGVAATKIAQSCRNGGWHVAIVDRRPYGGTCMLRGCDPKKLLWGVAVSAEQARRLARQASRLMILRSIGRR
jgi:pyruvate/2-oxoglutarate dehydrogenase complex dihydrolipoamide dehydrogenase (E3) component